MDQPTVPGVENGVDDAFLNVLHTLLPYYVNQQNEPTAVDLRSIYNKQDDVSYPFVGVLTKLREDEPIAISDIFFEDGPNLRATINEVETEILIMCPEIRELQNLKQFIELNLKYGRDPVSQIPWMHVMKQQGIVMNGFRPTEYERSDFQSIQQRTQNAQGNETQRLANIETLWETTICVVSMVQCGVKMNPINGVIQHIYITVVPQVTSN